MIGIHWIGPTSNIWSDHQCKHIRNFLGFDLEKCKKKCRETEGCTAINHSSKNKVDCVLRGCSTPVPLPTWSLPNYEGHYLSSGKLQS